MGESGLDVRYLLKQTCWIYFFTYLAAPLGYLVRIIYARQFSVQEFGLIYSILGFVGLVSIFNDVGFTETLKYHASRFYEKKQYDKVKGSLIFAFFMQFATAFFIIILLYFFTPWLAQNYFKSSIALSSFRWFLWYLLLFNITKPIIQIFVAAQDYMKLNLGEFLRNLIIFILSILLVFYPSLNSVSYIGFVFTITYLILFISFYFLARLKFPEIFNAKADLSFKLYKLLFNYASIIVLSTGAMILLSRIDIVLLTYFRNLTEVGFYSIALSLATTISVLFSPFIQIFFPLTSKLSVQGNISSIEKMIKIMYRFGLYVMVPVLLLFILYPGELINLLFGSKYLEAKIPLIILSLSLFISVLNSFNFNISAGLKLIKQRTKIMYVGATSNLIGGIILIPTYGMVGAAITTLFSVLIMFILSYILLENKLMLKLNKQIMFIILLLNILVLISVNFLKKVIVASPLIETGIIFVIVVPIYIMLGVYLKIINLERFLRIIKK